MNILFTICGRAGSKGLNNKNLKMFLGAPLPFYTLAVIELFKDKHSEYHFDTALNTDSSALKRLFLQANADVHYIDRKLELASDTASKKDVIADTYKAMKAITERVYDVIIDLDITSPLRTLKDLENLIEKKMASDAQVIYSVTTARRNPYFNMVKKTESGYERVIASDYTARQQAPELFDMNASLYAYTPELLMSGQGIFDVKGDVIFMKDTAVLDIDHEADFEYMEVIAEYLYKNNNEYTQVKKYLEGFIRI